MNFRKFSRLLHVPITDLFKRKTYLRLDAEDYADQLYRQAETVMSEFLAAYKKFTYSISEGIAPAPSALDARTEFSHECDQSLEKLTDKLKDFAVSYGVGEDEISSKLAREMKLVGTREFLAVTGKIIEEAKRRLSWYKSGWLDGAADSLREWQGYWERNGLDNVADIADPVIAKLKELAKEYKSVKKFLDEKA